MKFVAQANGRYIETCFKTEKNFPLFSLFWQIAGAKVNIAKFQSWHSKTSDYEVRDIDFCPTLYNTCYSSKSLVALFDFENRGFYLNDLGGKNLGWFLTVGDVEHFVTSQR